MVRFEKLGARYLLLFVLQMTSSLSPLVSYAQIVEKKDEIELIRVHQRVELSRHFSEPVVSHLGERTQVENQTALNDSSSNVSADSRRGLSRLRTRGALTCFVISTVVSLGIVYLFTNIALGIDEDAKSSGDILPRVGNDTSSGIFVPARVTVDDNRFLEVSTNQNSWIFVKELVESEALDHNVEYLLQAHQKPLDGDLTTTSGFVLETGAEMLTESGRKPSSLAKDRPKIDASYKLKNRRLLKLIGPNDTAFVSEIEESDKDFAVIKRHAAMTARVVTGDGYGCTGILVHKNLVLTSAHCFLDHMTGEFLPEKLVGAKAEFAIVGGRSRTVAHVALVYSAKYGKKSNAANGYIQDFVFLLLDQNIGSSVGWASSQALTFEEGRTYHEQFKSVVQGGTERVMSIVGFHGFNGRDSCGIDACYQTNRQGSCQLGGWQQGIFGLSLISTCDTAPGGSGSAYLETRLGIEGDAPSVVALHWGSVVNTPFNYAVPAAAFVPHIHLLVKDLEATESFGLNQQSLEFGRNEFSPIDQVEGI